VPEISVIVLNWNGKHFLEDCLSSLRRQTFRNFETILVDNGSTDGSVEYVRESFPEVIVEALPENLGFELGNLAGYNRASGELIVLLNNDTEVHPGFVEELHLASRRFPRAGSFATKMLYFEDRQRIDICGAGITKAGSTVAFGRDKLDGPEWSEAREVFAACAGAAGYRRKMIEDVGFLDGDFFMAYNDLDLSFRAQLRGYPCVFVPNAIVFHHYHATVKHNPSRHDFYSQRNIEYVYLKCMPFDLILRYLPLRLLYEFGAAAYFFRQGTGWAFVKAKFAVLRHLPMLLRKRKEIQRRRTLTSRQLLTLMENSWVAEKWNKLQSAWRRTSAVSTT